VPSASRLLVDVSPLRESAEYRRLFAGSALSSIGTQMTAVAVPVQIYSLTHSSLAVGFVGVFLAVPMITLGLIGGSIADAVDRRTLVLITSCALAATSILLALQALLQVHQVAVLYALVALQSATGAIDNPARRSFMRRLLPPQRIRAASALSFLYFHVSVLLGPLIAGVLIARSGFGTVYLVDAVTFGLAIYGVLRLRPMPAEPGGASPGLRAIAEGLRFVGRHPVLGVMFLADLDATIFGMPRALFPALAATHFGGLQVVGVLYAAPAIGGFLVAAFSGPLVHVRRQGAAILVGIGIWGCAIALFATTDILPLAVLLLAIAGAGDVLNGVFRSTLAQVVAPDALQGRVNSVAFIVGTGGPDVGDVEAGVIASLTSPVTSAVLGGVACVFGATIIALAAPAFRRFRLETANDL
jgi:MFS family permease